MASSAIFKNHEARGIFPQAMFDLCIPSPQYQKGFFQRPQNEEIQYGRFPSGYSISGEGLIDAYMHPILLS